VEPERGSVPAAARERAPRGEAEVLRLHMPQTGFSSQTSVTVSLRAAPSNRPSGPSSESGQGIFTDDEPPEIAFFCPECAEREFGCD
jgi:hypothetical protein